MLERARVRNIIKGTKLGCNGVSISHLQFADDTILFCNNDPEEMTNIKRILRCFQLMSSLRINFSKSSLCGMNVPQDVVVVLAQIMGCKVEQLPIKYLGLPLGANPGRIKTWDPVIERTEKVLSVWRSRCISTGGRLTLINSNTGNVPIYFMSLFKMPVVVASKLEKLQRQSFWGDSIDKKKMHLVKWEEITRKKDDGGLGVKRMLQQNLALLAKWWWRFGNNKEPLWAKVIIRGEYGLDVNCWLPYSYGASSTLKIWADICSLENPSSHLGYSI
ncbi:uncharacterized protein LOC131324659 [Rhododendron vialii]|uniref:uncharacterized protein LOC131324659 n=1 Tax=Rhododendron vialii TaxID=182163 RepID=UPI00265DCBC2|nr:uncharacterized protein LOC131324659 [Rhododendron vialii]